MEEIDFKEFEKKALQVLSFINSKMQFIPSSSNRVEINAKDEHLSGLTVDEIADILNVFQMDYEIVEFNGYQNVQGEIIFPITVIPDRFFSYVKAFKEETVVNTEEKSIISYKDLVIHKDKSFISIGDSKFVEISLKVKPIMFLLLLLEKPGSLFSYENLRKELDLYLPDPEEKSNNNGLSVLKQELEAYLIRCGVSPIDAKKIKGMIRSVNKSGYKLV